MNNRQGEEDGPHNNYGHHPDYIDVSKLERKPQARPNWDEYFMTLAKIASSRATCLSRPNGCILVKDNQVISTGYNGSMPGTYNCTEAGFCFRRNVNAGDHEKEQYSRAVHAETNAIAQAAKKGISIEGCTAYVTLTPCYDCLKIMASAGIKEIVYEHLYESVDRKRDAHWLKEIERAGIKLRQILLSESTKKLLIENIQGITAERRLKSE